MPKDLAETDEFAVNKAGTTCRLQVDDAIRPATYTLAGVPTASSEGAGAVILRQQRGGRVPDHRLLGRYHLAPVRHRRRDLSNLGGYGGARGANRPAAEISLNLSAEEVILEFQAK